MSDIETFLGALDAGVNAVRNALAARALWFANLWESNADRYEFFELAREIEPTLTLAQFEYGWQYRTVLNPDFKTAGDEFVNLLCGWY